MEVASLFTGKRDFAPTTSSSFYEPPMAKRVKFSEESPLFHPSELPAWTWPGACSVDDSDNDDSSKRGLEDFFARAAKRFKHDPESTVVSEEEASVDSSTENSSIIEETVDLELEEARTQVFQNDDIMERVIGFLDSASVQTAKGINQKWKNSCEHALERRQLADPSQTMRNEGVPRWVFDARFRVNEGGPLDYFPRVWYDGSAPKQDLQIEISGFSWHGSQTRSVNLMDPHSNRMIKLITQNLNCRDGRYHDLKILVERGRVFLKLDHHWLPGTLPVRELAKLLGICSWKGLPFEPSDMVEEEILDAELSQPDMDIDIMEE